jgi:hypothetical protein
MVKPKGLNNENDSLNRFLLNQAEPSLAEPFVNLNYET